MSRIYSHFLSPLRASLYSDHGVLITSTGRRRPFSQNPFLAETDLPTDESLIARMSSKDGHNDNDTEDQNDYENLVDHPDKQWGHRPPAWLELFYDLAWTASFSSLTSNSQFQNSEDTISYIVFFTTAWWMWVSQTLYTAEYYTDDWLNLMFVCLQLVVYGALAATTRGFQVFDFITHTPGSVIIEPSDLNTLSRTPSIYRARLRSLNSLKVITITIAASRLLLLIRYLRVAIYAKITPRVNRRFPFQLLIIPTSLLVSTMLFFAAYRVTTDIGTTPHGARIKFALWGVGILVEMVAYIVEFQMKFGEKGLRARSHGPIVERFCSITVIILGEGVNAIAGTLYALQQAPGFGPPNAGSIFCFALIAFFLAYLYFEGPTSLTPVRRRLSWAFVHLPWLLSVILLLEDMRGQIMLLSLLKSSQYLTRELGSVLFERNYTPNQLDQETRRVLIQGGFSYDVEWKKYTNLKEANASAGGNVADDRVQNELIGVWYLREQLEISVSMYNNFMPEEMISRSTSNQINEYHTNYSYALQDLSRDDVKSLRIGRLIIADLMRPQLMNTRYIMAMVGLTFISLASLNLIQSWPKDRYRWASITTRYVLGTIMTFLLLLNIGKYQTYFAPKDMQDQRAPIFSWFSEAWVLPTIALAYATQFIVDTVLTYISARRPSQAAENSEEEKLMEHSSPVQTPKQSETSNQSDDRRRLGPRTPGERKTI